MRKLVDRKFGEVEATHKLFVDLLHRLEKAAQGAKTRVSSGKNVSSATSALTKVVGSIEATRKKKIVERMKEYQEAPCLSGLVSRSKEYSRRSPTM
jgi:hypothetical protein